MIARIETKASKSILFTVKNMSTFPQPTPERQSEIIQNYNRTLSTVNGLISKFNTPPVTLVAVSKLKPSSDIMALYNIGVRHFGENYVQELITKSRELPKDIKWHFIGGLQTGKCKDLGKNVDNLYAVETIDSLKKCKKLDSVNSEVKGTTINVFLQINTSGEEQKSGFSLGNLEELFETIQFLNSDGCTSLKLSGLMTIGSFAESTSDGADNEDFTKLLDLKELLEKKFEIKLELSMGMSNDFEQAIKQGSTNVRVGSSIFGARPPKH